MQAIGSAFILLLLFFHPGSLPAEPGIPVESTWGLPILNAVAANPRNVRFEPHACQLDGFGDDRSPTRVPSIRLTAKQGRITIQAPAAGAYYPAMQIYDGPGAERLRVSVEGKEQAVIAAEMDDQRERLFFLARPLDFRGGEAIEFETLPGEGAYRVEAVYLLEAKPVAQRPVLTITDVLVEVDHARRQAVVGWLTNWPVAAVFEWQAAGAARAETVVEDTAVRNHRIVRSSLQAGRAYRFRIRGKNRFGEAAQTDWQTVRVDAPRDPAGNVTRATIPLTVKNPMSAERLAAPFPVSSGISFPEGALGTDQKIRLLDGRGNELPLQTSPLARWPDGTVKWALVDFISRPGAELQLEYGSAVQRREAPGPLHIVDTPARIEVTTGPLRFRIGRRTSGFIDSLWLDINRDGEFSPAERILSPARPAVFVLTDDTGAPFTTLAAPDEVSVEHRGPLRVSLLFKGHHRHAAGGRSFRYLVRLDAFAGQTNLRVQHTFENDRGEEEFTSIRSLELRLPLGEGANAWVLGDQRGASLREAARLVQETDDRFSLAADGVALASGRRADGWAEWSNTQVRVALGVRDFWQSYPKELAVSRQGLKLGLCPPLPADSYAEAKGTVDEHRLYYYLQNGRYKFRQGMSKTHEFWLDFQSSGAEQPPAIRQQRTPLLAVPPPSWYVDSKGFGELAPPGAGGAIARYDAALARGLAEYLEDRERDRAYGMLNFGDWWGERVINWGNSEYDVQNALLLQFARTGDPRYFLTAEEAEWHHRDVDTIHAHRDPSRVGGAYHHAIGHTGDYYAQSPAPGQGIAKGILTVDHVFVDGHLNYYYLTGDRRSLETARKIADRYDIYETRAYDFADSRIAGWHLILTTAAYRATRDPLYLNAARLIVERALERQEGDGGWNRLHICSHENEPEHRGELGYMQGVMMAGLRRYFALTGDERAAQAIVRGTDFLVNHLWVPEVGRFKYASCPRAGALDAADALNFLLLDGMVFAYQRTGEARWRPILVEATRRALESMESFGTPGGRRGRSGFGKVFAMYACLAPYSLAYLAGLD